MPENIHEHLELSLHIVERAPYRSLSLFKSAYPHWILSYVLNGDVETSCCGETWRARDGDIMIHPPHLPFSEIATGPGTHLWMLLQVTTSHNIDLFRLYPVSPVLTLPAELGYVEQFLKLYQIWHNPQAPLRNVRATALACELCAIVLEGWWQAGAIPRSASLSTSQDRFVDVIKYMETHLEQKLLRDELAARVHLHPGYFDRVFRQIYGVSPMQMLRDLRLRRTRSLLETTDLSLSAIAVRCGLGDAGYLSRVFRQRYGRTPGEYRDGIKSAMESYLSPLSPSSSIDYTHNR